MLQLTIPEIILRLVLAMVMGGAIGFERQYKNRPRDAHSHFSLYGRGYYCVNSVANCNQCIERCVS